MDRDRRWPAGARPADREEQSRLIAYRQHRACGAARSARPTRAGRPASGQRAGRKQRTLTGAPAYVVHPHQHRQPGARHDDDDGVARHRSVLVSAAQGRSVPGYRVPRRGRADRVSGGVAGIGRIRRHAQDRGSGQHDQRHRRNHFTFVRRAVGRDRAIRSLCGCRAGRPGRARQNRTDPPRSARRREGPARAAL